MMAKTERLILLSCASIMATSAMTIFSYALSKICKENYREPAHLASIAREINPGKAAVIYRATGWFLHYTAGVVWALAYALPFENARVSQRSKPAILGVSSGLLAALVWKLVLIGHPRSASRVEPRFFAQLIPAHLVFSTALEVCNRLAAGSSEKDQQSKFMAN